jgi:hypothetical protein
MTKRQVLVMTFLCAFAFGGVFGEFSNLEAKPKKKTTQTSKKKKSGKTSKKKSSGKKNTKKSSGKKNTKKKSGKKNTKKKYSKKKKRNSNRVRTPRVYTPPTNGTYTPPKTYDNNSGNTEPEKNERQYKRENTDPVKKEPKKDGE